VGTFQGRIVQTVSLVGNGPVSRAAAPLIDTADLVVRINRARLGGWAGQRTDALAIVEHTIFGRLVTEGRPLNPRVLADLKEIWLSVDPARSGDGPFAAEFHAQVRRDRPTVFVGQDVEQGIRDTLIALGASPHVIPSTGALTLYYLLGRFPAAAIRLFGFTHEGWNGHAWSAEREWMAALQAGGRIEILPATAPLVRTDLKDEAAEQAARARKNVRKFFRRLGRRLRGEPVKGG
jgi:hypothetical protein